MHKVFSAFEFDFLPFPTFVRNNNKTYPEEGGGDGEEGGKCRKQQCFLFSSVAKPRGRSEYNFMPAPVKM